MKSKFVKSTFILIIGGFVTKILGMFIKIVMTRLLGTEGIGMYMLVSPTFMLFISIASLGLPVAISKLVAENNRNNKNLVFLCFPITIVVPFIFMFCLKHKIDIKVKNKNNKTQHFFWRNMSMF